MKSVEWGRCSETWNLRAGDSLVVTVAPGWNRSTASAPSSQLSVRLECVYSYMSDSGKNRSRKETIKWAEEGQPRVESAGKGVVLVFRFDVPDTLHEADIKQKDAYHYWRLTVKAVIQGVDLYRQYNIPVFKSGEESRYIRHDISAQVVEHKAQQSEATKNSIALGDFDLPGLSRSMRTSTLGEDLTLVFPMFRNKALTFFVGIFVLQNSLVLMLRVVENSTIFF